MNENVTLFGRLQKIADTDDGSLRVEGIASSKAIDSQGEIVTAEAMRAALPDFFKHGTGALREMHQMAAGSVLEAEIDKQGRTRIVAKVVDPVAIRKVRAGVYVGFSIGGKSSRATQ